MSVCFRKIIEDGGKYIGGSNMIGQGSNMIGQGSNMIGQNGVGYDDDR